MTRRLSPPYVEAAAWAALQGRAEGDAPDVAEEEHEGSEEAHVAGEGSAASRQPAGNAATAALARHVTEVSDEEELGLLMPPSGADNGGDGCGGGTTDAAATTKCGRKKGRDTESAGGEEQPPRWRHRVERRSQAAAEGGDASSEGDELLFER